MRYLSVEDVLRLHDNTIHHEGGLHGVRDFGLLESAVSMPRQTFGGTDLHESLAAKAAAYLFHIAQNHPFRDGNKRAAVISAYVFLAANGVTLQCTPDELEAATMYVASGEWDKVNITEWFER